MLRGIRSIMVDESQRDQHYEDIYGIHWYLDTKTAEIKRMREGNETYQNINIENVESLYTEMGVKVGRVNGEADRGLGSIFPNSIYIEAPEKLLFIVHYKAGRRQLYIIGNKSRK